MKNATTLAQKLGRTLKRRRQTLALAESCTGGLIASTIVSLPGASQFFEGAVVSYANRAKHGLLGVRNHSLKKFGAVSPEVAMEMARGAKKKLRVTWALSVTGVAGPSGGTKKKPVGLIYYAVVGPKIETVEGNRFKGTRNKIQRSAMHSALTLLEECLEGDTTWH